MSFTNKLKIIYWPEFLNDLTPNSDFINEIDIILGSDMMEQDTIKNCILIESVFDHIENIDYLSISDAINFKYIRNSYIAWKITFWNMMADSSLMDQRTLKKLMRKYPLKSEMIEIALDGKLGYGGKCIPKDFDAFHSTLSNKSKIMFEAVSSFNRIIRKFEKE
jgi:UDPglucose 6-dehydrogenase